MNENVKLYQGDCLEVMDRLIAEGVKVDAIITDPPYGTVKNIGNSNCNHGMAGKTEWDSQIDLSNIWRKSDMLLREKGALILFSQEPYTSNIIFNSHINLPFSYKNIWVKDHFANSLIAKKAPVNYFEEICVFFRKYDTFNENPLRKYFGNVMDYISLDLKKINKKLGHRKAEHSFYIESTQFKLCTKQTYDELIHIFKIDCMKGFKTYNELYTINKKYQPTFNIWDNKKYKSNVLYYKKDYNGFHPTQKPVELMEDLVKTYTNEGNTVLDFTMGSGSTGVACINTNRKFIGIELDEGYFNIAQDRIHKALSEKENI